LETRGTYRILVFLIFVGTVYVLAASVIVRHLLARWHNNTSRSRPGIWYSRIILTLAAAGVLCGLYGYFVEPYWPEITHVQIKSTKVQRGSGPVRVALISDLHSDPKVRLENRLPTIIEKEKPDLIVFTGDCVNSVDGVPVFKQCMSQLSKLAPTFGVRGNWDTAYWRAQDLFGDTGVRELDGQGVDIDIRGTLVSINGFAVGHEAGITEALDRMRPTTFNLFLYHYPDEIETLADHGVDLYCAGHTHGGQIALPWYGALITLSKFDKKYESGLYRVLDTFLYVNRGIGMEGGRAPRVRFCARPEVTVIDIVSAEKPLKTAASAQ